MKIFRKYREVSENYAVRKVSEKYSGSIRKVLKIIWEVSEKYSEVPGKYSWSINKYLNNFQEISGKCPKVFGKYSESI